MEAVKYNGVYVLREDATGSGWLWLRLARGQVSPNFHLFVSKGRKKHFDSILIWKHTKLCEPLNLKSVSCAHVPINTKLHIFFSPINHNFKNYLLHAPESVWRWWTKQSVLLTSWSGHPTKFQTVFSFLSILSRTETFVLGLDKKQKTAENWNCPVFQKTILWHMHQIFIQLGVMIKVMDDMI